MIRVIVSSVLIVLSFLMVFLISLPEYRNVKKIRDYSARLEELDAQIDKILSDWSRIVAEYKAIKPSDVDKLSVFYATEDDSLDLQAYVDNILSKFNGDVRVDDISVVSNDKKDNDMEGEGASFAKQSIFMSLSSNSFLDLMEVLGTLEYSLRLINVKNFSVIASDDDVSRGGGFGVGDAGKKEKYKYTMEINAEAFWRDVSGGGEDDKI